MAYECETSGTEPSTVHFVTPTVNSAVHSLTCIELRRVCRCERIGVFEVEFGEFTKTYQGTPAIEFAQGGLQNTWTWVSLGDTELSIPFSATPPNPFTCIQRQRAHSTLCFFISALATWNIWQLESKIHDRQHTCQLRQNTYSSYPRTPSSN